MSTLNPRWGPTREFFAPIEGVDVDGSTVRKFLLQKMRLLDLESSNPYVFHNARLLPLAVKNPSSIWKGWKRDGHESSLCYVSRPLCRYGVTGCQMDAVPGFVFCVFVSDSFQIIKWKWTEAAMQDDTVPRTHEFDHLLWKT